MPLYEYKCEKCGDVFEKLQKFSDEPTAIHETCGGAVHRLISTSALLFKGSGFYVNDYAKSGSPGAANGGKKDGDNSAGGKDGKDKENAAASKESAGGASSDSTKSEAAKSDGSKSAGSNEGSKDTSKSTPTPTTAVSSTSSDKK